MLILLAELHPAACRSVACFGKRYMQLLRLVHLPGTASMVLFSAQQHAIMQVSMQCEHLPECGIVCVQILVMLKDFHEPAPEGAELEEFLAHPKHHLARLIKDLLADEAAATTMEVGLSSVCCL